MIKIYHVRGTRSVRPIWLCYELELPVDIEPIDFSPAYRDSKEWRDISPAGKVPAMTDNNMSMFESGAIVDYILERYSEGRLHPKPGTSASAIHHQWCWFAEATLIRPLGLHRILKARDEDISVLVAEGERKARDCLEVVEKALADQDYLLGHEFSAADIMMGYSLSLVEKLFDDKYLKTQAYLDRLRTREAYLRAMKV